MLKIEAFSGGFDKNFSYLIWCDESHLAAVVDPATDPAPLIQTLTRYQLQLDKMVLTHTHADHTASHVSWLQQFPGIRTYGSAPVNGLAGPYEQLADKAVLQIGIQLVQMLHTPGHFPDCVCWYAADAGAIFTGDTIFVGRPGRVIGALSDISQLYHSIYQRILPLPEATRVYPGHDYGPKPTATLAELQAKYPFFACRNEVEFRQLMTAYEEIRH